MIPHIGKIKTDVNRNKKNKDNYRNNLKAVIKNKRIWLIIGMTILTPFVLNFSRNTFRVYGALVSMDGGVLQYSQLFIGFSTVFIFPIWGIINSILSILDITKSLGLNCLFFLIFATVEYIIYFTISLYFFISGSSALVSTSLSFCLSFLSFLILLLILFLYFIT